MEQTFITLGGFVGLLAYIIWQDWKSGKLGGKETLDRSAPPWAQKLVNHFNHEQTDILNNIKDGIKELNNQHKTWNEYGIKVRGCDDKMK